MIMSQNTGELDTSFPLSCQNNNSQIISDTRIQTFCLNSALFPYQCDLIVKFKILINIYLGVINNKGIILRFQR